MGEGQRTCWNFFPQVKKHYGGQICRWYSFSNSSSCHFLQKQEYEQDQQKLENKQHKKERDQLLSEIDHLEKLMKDTKNALEDQQRKNSGML